MQSFKEYNSKSWILYHGTNASFEYFKDDIIFLTDDIEIAKIYARNNGRVIKVKASINNPFDTRKKEHRKIFENEFYRQWGNGAPLSDNNLPDWTDSYDFVDFFKEKGYTFDAVYIQEPQGISIAVFSSKQITILDDNIII